MSCQTSEEPDPQLKRAFEVHEMALEVQDSLQIELQALANRPLPPEQQQALVDIQDTHAQWKELLVEVPGFEHAEGHDHDHDHSHGHDATTEVLQSLPPEEILKIQEALLQEVQRLLDEAHRLSRITEEKHPNP